MHVLVLMDTCIGFNGYMYWFKWIHVLVLMDTCIGEWEYFPVTVYDL